MSRTRRSRTVHGLRASVAVLLLAAAVLTAAAWLRGAEYDEQYTLFLTAGQPRPAWPVAVLTAAEVLRWQTGTAGPLEIARELRDTDVHPPLYFWTAAIWRGVLSVLDTEGLFAARLLSVGCALGALWLLGVLARRCGIPPASAMLLTLGCYGFAYTAVVARGFALAQLLTLGGIALGLSTRRGPRGLAAGWLLGAATLTNYLAAFVAVAAILTMPRRRVAAWMAAGYAMLLPAAAWFYAAQRDGRDGQFPPFSWWSGLVRLARYEAANLVGGLPLYVEPPLRAGVLIGLAGMLLGLTVLVCVRWRSIARPSVRRLLPACAAAPAAGLLALGLLFDTLPIELRYLAFATPFLGLLLAGALGSLTPRRALAAQSCVLAVQAVALAGMMLLPETMQPARAVAREAATLSGQGVVLVPFGNDGVGIVGAFAREAPPALPLMIVRRGTPEAILSAHLAGYQRVAVGLLGQDMQSRATLAELAEIFAGPRWRPVARTPELAVFEPACHGSAGAGGGSDCDAAFTGLRERRVSGDTELP